MSRHLKAGSRERSHGHLEATKGSDTIRSSSRKAGRKPSARWSRLRNARSRTGHGPSRSSPMLSSDPGETGFGIYVHWPFCLAKCPYCDFNSHVRHGGIDAEAYASALTRELDWFAEQA